MNCIVNKNLHQVGKGNVASQFLSCRSWCDVAQPRRRLVSHCVLLGRGRLPGALPVLPLVDDERVDEEAWQERSAWARLRLTTNNGVYDDGALLA